MPKDNRTIQSIDGDYRKLFKSQAVDGWQVLGAVVLRSWLDDIEQCKEGSISSFLANERLAKGVCNVVGFDYYEQVSRILSGEVFR